MQRRSYGYIYTKTGLLTIGNGLLSRGVRKRTRWRTIASILLLGQSRNSCGRIVSTRRKRGEGDRRGVDTTRRERARKEMNRRKTMTLIMKRKKTTKKEMMRRW